MNSVIRINFFKNYLWQLPLQITQNNAAVGADIVREMRSSSSGDPGSPVFSFNEKSSSKKGDRRDTSSRYIADHTGIKWYMIPNCTVKSGLYANVRKLHSTYGNPHHVPMSYYLKLAVHTAHVYRVWQKVRLPGWMIPPSGGPCPRPLWQPWNRTYAEPCRWISRCTKKCTVIGTRMSHWKWRETKQHPSRARSGHQIGCSLVSLHFLCDILAPITVQMKSATKEPGSHGVKIRTVFKLPSPVEWKLSTYVVEIQILNIILYFFFYSSRFLRLIYLWHASSHMPIGI